MTQRILREFPPFCLCMMSSSIKARGFCRGQGAVLSDASKCTADEADFSRVLGAVVREQRSLQISK
jgi:hypothetical protein